MLRDVEKAMLLRKRSANLLRHFKFRTRLFLLLELNQINIAAIYL
jgi:hypothetical protein